MNELLASPFVLGGYWGARADPVEDCARRLAECLRGLAEISDVLEGWFRKGRSKSAASREPVAPTVESLQTLLLAGRQRRDDDGGVMAELGFSLSLWNRQPKAAAWSLTCGAYPASGVGVLNYFVLNWPDQVTDATLAEDLVTARAVMLNVVQSWEPDWATWTSDALRNSQQLVPRQPVLGLSTYLGAARSLPPLPLEEFAVQAFGLGHLVSLDPTNPDLAGRLARLHEALSREGALRPTA